MCTLTFLPSIEKKIFTFSRDEEISRKNTIPQYHFVDDKRIFFPKDERKGGTWIATNTELFVCLLNAEHLENLNKKYTESRGNVVLNRFVFNSNKEFLENLKLENTAPFTLIISNSKEKNLTQISWNGVEKTLLNIDANEPNIWSSSTLYPILAQNKRKTWFKNFLENKDITSENIWKFHLADHTTEKEENILMKRNDGKATISISQIIFEKDNCEFRYLDVLNSQKKEQKWSIKDLQLH